MRFVYLACLISLGFSPVVNSANDLLSPLDTKPGQFYAGISLLKSDGECQYQGVTCDSSGYKLATGYKFNDNFAIEGGYYDLFSNDGVNPITAEKSTVNGTGLVLSTVGSYHIDNTKSISGRVGFMAWDVEANKAGTPVASMDGTDILLGVGGGYRLNDHWQLRGEYEHVGGDLETHIYSLGTTLSTL